MGQISLLGPTGKCSKRQVRTLDQAIGALAARTRTFGPRHCSNISALYRTWDKTFVLSQVLFVSERKPKRPGRTSCSDLNARRSTILSWASRGRSEASSRPGYSWARCAPKHPGRTSCSDLNAPLRTLNWAPSSRVLTSRPSATRGEERLKHLMDLAA